MISQSKPVKIPKILGVNAVHTVLSCCNIQQVILNIKQTNESFFTSLVECPETHILFTGFHIHRKSSKKAMQTLGPY